MLISWILYIFIPYNIPKMNVYSMFVHPSEKNVDRLDPLNRQIPSAWDNCCQLGWYKDICPPKCSCIAGM